MEEQKVGYLLAFVLHNLYHSLFCRCTQQIGNEKMTYMTKFEDWKDTLDMLRDIVCLLIVIIRSEWLLILFWPVYIGWAYYACKQLRTEWATESSVKQVVIHILKKNKWDMLWLILLPVLAVVYFGGFLPFEKQ